MAFSLQDNQQVTLSVTATDSKGNPATFSSVPTWLVDAPAVLALTPAADGLSCLAVAVGPLGDAVVTCKADLGGGTTATGTLAVTVVGSAPVNIVITPGAPVNQP